MQLADPWDTILARKAAEAPAVVQAAEARRKSGLIAIGVGLLLAALMMGKKGRS